MDCFAHHSQGQFVAKSRVQGKSFKAHTGGVDSAWQLLKESIPKSVSTRAKKAQPNSTVKYTCKDEPGNGDGRTQLQETFLQKNGNGIPAQERHLRKESGKMATKIAPKLRFQTKTPNLRGGGNESQTVRTDGILPVTNTQNSLAPYFLFSTVTNASKHLKKRNTPDKQKRKIALPK